MKKAFSKKTLKPILLFSLIITLTLSFISLKSQTLEPGDLIWYTFQGGSLSDEAYGIDKDSDGNLYIVGHGQSDWDMTGQTSVSPKLQHKKNKTDRPWEVFVAKFNSSGELVWYTFIGDADSNDYGWDIAVDSDGEVFIVGQTNNWYQGGAVWSEENRAFLAKFDNDGNFLWMHKMGSRASSADNACAVDVDASGNVYMMGSSVYGWNWPNPDGEPFEPINSFINDYGSNYFIAKFNHNGDYQWHTFIGPHAVGGNRNGGNMDIVVKGSDIYLTGASYRRMSITDVTPAIDHDHGNENDRVCQEGFVMKMSSLGDITWYSYVGYDYNAASLNSGDGAWPNGIDADMAGNIYITGNSPRKFIYSPPPVNEKYAFGDPDCFIMKLNSNDNTTNCIEWSTFWSYSLNDRGEDIKLDGKGNVYVGANGLTSSNVILMLDNNGNKEWLRGLSEYPGTGNIKSLLLDANGSLFFTGFSGPWSSSLEGTLIHQHTNYNDAFLAKMHSGSLNQPPVISATFNQVTVDEGETATNTGILSDSDGDDISLTATAGAVTNNNDDTWSWSYQTKDGPANSQTVTITADDGNGETAKVSFNVTVNNVAPEITEIDIPLDPVAFDAQPVNVSVFYSDPAGLIDAPFKCTFEFGDGSIETKEISALSCTSSGHSYTSAGVYTITVKVEDKDDGLVSKTASTYMVIYDPSEGFVTGGGWIESPEGAYIDDPTLTGKANFGFVSKYKKGKTVPEGNTEFKFHAADLNFHSSLYDWLVIAGAKAMFKGEGTINNSGWYGFQLSAIDAALTPSTDKDLFRIQIWDKNQGDVIVYDNKVGETDPNADPTTEIGGGNIVIHQSKQIPKSALFEENPPQSFSITNYPNPFAESTRIQFSLPEETHVLLKVFDVQGKAISVLSDKNYLPGTYTIRFDAKGLSPGNYYYSITTNNYTQTKRMVLFK